MNGMAVAGIIMMLFFIPLAGIVLYQEYTFDIAIGGHMERAANSNSIELATQEMETVVKAMEEKHLTEGFTSIIFRTPDEDVGFWYQNMKSSLAELKTINASATPLEKSNVLMKLRESLKSAGDSGSSIVVPSGIARFPENKFWFMFNTLLLVIIILGWVIYIRNKD